MNPLLAKIDSKSLAGFFLILSAYLTLKAASVTVPDVFFVVGIGGLFFKEGCGKLGGHSKPPAA